MDLDRGRSKYVFIYTIYHYIYDIYIYRQGVDHNGGQGQRLLRAPSGRVGPISRKIFFSGSSQFFSRVFSVRSLNFRGQSGRVGAGLPIPGIQESPACWLLMRDFFYIYLYLVLSVLVHNIFIYLYSSLYYSLYSLD